MSDLKKEFGKIYDDYIDKIYRFVYLKVNSEEIAQDLTSDTFLKVWEAYQKSPKIDNINAFLYRVARNLTIDYYRQKGRTSTVSIDEIPIVDPGQDIEEKVIFKADLNNVKACLANLKEDYQNVIVLHYLDDLPIKQVAQMMERTDDATRVLLHRALKALKNEVKRGEA